VADGHHEAGGRREHLDAERDRVALATSDSVSESSPESLDAERKKTGTFR
jgi:hypothetical protein